MFKLSRKLSRIFRMFNLVKSLIIEVLIEFMFYLEVPNLGHIFYFSIQSYEVSIFKASFWHTMPTSPLLKPALTSPFKLYLSFMHRCCAISSCSFPHNRTTPHNTRSYENCPRTCIELVPNRLIGAKKCWQTSNCEKHFKTIRRENWLRGWKNCLPGSIVAAKSSDGRHKTIILCKSNIIFGDVFL